MLQEKCPTQSVLNPELLLLNRHYVENAEIVTQKLSLLGRNPP